MIIILIIFCIFIISLREYIIHHGRSGKLINLIPGPRRTSFFGHVLQMFNFSTEELWIFQRANSTLYYPIFKIWIFARPIIFIQHPDDIKAILSNTKHNVRGYPFNYFLSWLKNSIIFSKKTKWQQKRRILTPAFHCNILKRFANVFIQESDYITKSLKNNEGTIIEDLVSFMRQHTLNIISKTVMGISLQDMGILQKQYCQIIYDMYEILINRFMSPWLQNDILFALSSLGRKQTKNLEILNGIIEKVIAERKNYHERTNGRYLKNFETDTMTNNMKETGTQTKQFAIVDLLIAASRVNNLSDVDIRQEINAFIFEGHDTVTMGICFALLLLAEHREIQNHVRNEVTTAMKEDGEITTAVLQNVPYLERCLKESLRLYPSVSFISRECAEDVKLNSYVVPSGTTVYLDTYNLHRDPNFWSNPDVFDPDRFLPEKIENRHPYSYIPFGAEPRSCIGERFAMLEMKAVVAQLVWNFYLETVDSVEDLHLKGECILRIAHPIRIKCIPIEISRRKH